MAVDLAGRTSTGAEDTLPAQMPAKICIKRLCLCGICGFSRSSLMASRYGASRKAVVRNSVESPPGGVTVTVDVHSSECVQIEIVGDWQLSATLVLVV
jgi:hypothetical protein